MRIFRCVFVIAAAFLIYGCTKTLRASPQQTTSSGDSAAVEGGTSARGSMTIAVLPFRDDSGENSGDVLAESVSLDLLKIPGLVVVERSRIESVLRELRLSKTDLVDPTTAAKVGKLLGAQLMLFGSISKLGGDVIATTRVVSVETGRILGGKIERSDDPRSLESALRRAARESLALAFLDRRVLFARATTDVIPEPPADDDVDREIPDGGKALQDAFAVVIGVKDYKNRDVPEAKFALNDARLMKRYLVKAAGFPEQNVIYLENPTKAEMETVFGSDQHPAGRLVRLIGSRHTSRADVLVYYSGHGAPGLKTKHSYFVPSDADPNYVEIGGYPRDLMLKNLSGIGARSVTVVLDACFSGSYDQGSLIRQASPLTVVTDDWRAPRGITLLTSAGANEVSSWYAEKQHSLFTYFLIRDMEAASRRGGVPTFGQLMDQVGEQVSGFAARALDRDQEPQFSGDRRQKAFFY